MKILITTDAFPPGGGGSAQSTAALARALAGNNHDVSVVVGRRNVLGELRKDWQGVAVIEVGLGKSTPGRTVRELRLASFREQGSASERFDRAHAQHWLSARARMLGAILVPGGQPGECRLAAKLARHCARAVPGFGASDCRCGGHLFYAERL